MAENESRPKAHHSPNILWFQGEREKFVETQNGNMEKKRDIIIYEQTKLNEVACAMREE